MPSERSRHIRQFFAGLGFGSIALAILWGSSIIGVSRIGMVIIGLVLAGIAFLIQVICGLILVVGTPERRLRFPERRFVGYGIVVMSLVSVIVAQQGCALISKG